MFDKKKDLYAALGLQSNASELDVKRAFRTLASQHHPDKNPNDASAEIKFKNVNEAYQDLMIFSVGLVVNVDQEFTSMMSSKIFSLNNDRRKRIEFVMKRTFKLQ